MTITYRIVTIMLITLHTIRMYLSSDVKRQFELLAPCTHHVCTSWYSHLTDGIVVLFSIGSFRPPGEPPYFPIVLLALTSLVSTSPSIAFYGLRAGLPTSSTAPKQSPRGSLKELWDWMLGRCMPGGRGSEERKRQEM